MNMFEDLELKEHFRDLSVLELYREYMEPASFTEEDREAFEEYARERTTPILIFFLYFVLGVTMLSLMTDPWVFRDQPQVLDGLFWIWVTTLGLSLSGLLDYYFGSQLIRKYPNIVGVVIGMVIAVGFSCSTNLIGRLDLPLFYFVYLIPFLTSFLIGLHHKFRTACTLLVAWGCLVGYLLFAPSNIWTMHFVFHASILHISAALSIGGGKIVHDLFRQSFLQERKALRERERAEGLVRNILPEPVAEELKNEERVIADYHENVTVLFADIVDFTPMTSQLSAREVVDLLNGIFSEFDILVEEYGLEKIKTIGDEYMVAAGLPTEREDHAQQTADLSLDMMQHLENFESPHADKFEMRMGINTGSVVAGVIGLDKFVYDLWGDTVNVASRMESEGIPGKIQVTPSTYNRLSKNAPDRYQFHDRGPVQVKGMGKIQTYLLENRLQN